MPRLLTVLPVIALAAVALLHHSDVARAASPSWTEWERAHTHGRHGDFLVVREPEGGSCYVKQSYRDDPSHIELTVRAGEAPVLVGAWIRGVEGPLSYRVDGGVLRSVWVKTIASFELDPEVLSEMRAGNYLRVSVEPRGLPVWRQRLSLRGFTAATRELDACGAGATGVAP